MKEIPAQAVAVTIDIMYVLSVELQLISQRRTEEKNMLAVCY